MEAYARPSLYNLAPFNFTGVTLPRQFPAEHCSSPCHALTFTCRGKGHLHHHPVAPTQHQILWNCKGKGKNNEKNNVNLHLLCARCSTHRTVFFDAFSSHHRRSNKAQKFNNMPKTDDIHRKWSHAAHSRACDHRPSTTVLGGVGKGLGSPCL